MQFFDGCKNVSKYKNNLKKEIAYYYLSVATLTLREPEVRACD